MEDREYKITLKKFFGHLHTVNKHRFKVFKLSCRCGIPVQGLLHDLSKYSFVEFLEGVKYFQGDYSPIINCKKKNGYSKAWLHHKGRNKHHFEYWYDYAIKEQPNIPYKYFVELICDCFAAGMVYQGKNWKKDYQISYWNKINKDGAVKINKNMNDLITRVFDEVGKNGIEYLNKKNLRELYDYYVKEV